MCVPSEATIGEALRLMMQHHLGQLPVIDEHGQLVGMISADAILSTLYYSKGSAPILNLPVNHCQDEAKGIDVECDFIAALEQLNGQGGLSAASLAVTQDCRPIAIFSQHDLTVLCQTLLEAHTLLQSIATSLRGYINAALREKNADGSPDASASSSVIEQLNLCQLINLINDDGLWPFLEDTLAPRSLFVQWMIQVCDLSQRIWDEHGQIDTTHIAVLRRIQAWLNNRPKLAD